jgi:hypothetical protein
LIRRSFTSLSCAWPSSLRKIWRTSSTC